MQSKSEGSAVPALPNELRRDLLAKRNRPAENYDRRVGPKGIVTWPASGDELPGVFFAALEAVEGKSWLLRGMLVPDEHAHLLQLARLTIEPWGHDDEVTGALLRLL